MLCLHSYTLKMINLFLWQLQLLEEYLKFLSLEEKDDDKETHVSKCHKKINLFEVSFHSALPFDMLSIPS